MTEMFFQPRVLSILTTRRCTAACDHCCIGASPRAKGAIPVDRIHRLIDEARRIPSIERIVFTGGECFLLGRKLDVLVGHAAESGFSTRVITNGYWAVTDHAALMRVVGLRDAGLDEMMISTGTFHQQFVPVERIVRAARVTADHGIPVRISVEDCDQSRFDVALLRDNLRDAVAAGKIYISLDPWIPDAGDRGSSILSHEHILTGEAPRDSGRCAQILNVISVTPDQQLISCCGYPLEELPSLRLGSVADRSLDEIVFRTPRELLKMWLHVAGPSGIAEFVAQRLPGFSLPASPSICQTCVTLQRDQRAMSVVANHAGEVVQLISSEFSRLQGPQLQLHTA